MVYILLIYITLLNLGNVEKEQINKVLDNLHKYASEANGEKYFQLFNNQAVFHGTDLNERWSIDEFKKYAQNRFDTGTGWTYKSLERNICKFPGGKQDQYASAFGGCNFIEFKNNNLIVNPLRL